MAHSTIPAATIHIDNDNRLVHRSVSKRCEDHRKDDEEVRCLVCECHKDLRNDLFKTYRTNFFEATYRPPTEFRLSGTHLRNTIRASRTTTPSVSCGERNSTDISPPIAAAGLDRRRCRYQMIVGRIDDFDLRHSGVRKFSVLTQK